MLRYGTGLKVAAAAGIVLNLQVTCPLITFSLRDLCAKVRKTVDYCKGDEMFMFGAGRSDNKKTAVANCTKTMLH